MKKILNLLIVVTIIAFLYGCGGGGGGKSAPFANNEIISSETKDSTVIDGKLSPITFSHTDSGETKISCADGTFPDGVKLNVQEFQTTDTGLNPLGTPQNIYVYKISASSANGSTDVSVLDKPLTIILPTTHLGTEGICYVGVRNSESDPWITQGSKTQAQSF